MPTVQELGLLASAVYDEDPAAMGWSRKAFQPAKSGFDGFQAAAFAKGNDTVVAFRGTAQPMDAVADVKLGCGMNSTYFSAAENFADPYVGIPKVYLCGHSLGGAITQVVANRKGFKFVSFNAPGVAVLASRNVLSGTLEMTAIRSIGMLASALRHPIQALSDVTSALNVVHGVNVCLENDVVSKIGIHYGEIVTIPGTSINPLTEHGIATINKVLETADIGQKDVASC